MNGVDQARQMVVMAAKDIKAMKSLLSPESADDEIFGFHAQQAVEKTLKAWITVAGGSYGFVHDIHVLLLSLREQGCDIRRFKGLLLLNVYAVRFRYEPLDMPTSTLDRSEMLGKVVELYEHVQLAIDTAAVRPTGL
ncbi:MAG: HEPN domain-containing protein [Proteobacteria bacterium]|nr:HEPN domain-containing protein [Pseudomonadota bacterium]